MAKKTAAAGERTAFAGISLRKVRKILRDGTVHGHRLSGKQKKALRAREGEFTEATRARRRERRRKR